MSKVPPRTPEASSVDGPAAPQTMISVSLISVSLISVSFPARTRVDEA
jgi:hypothetical protein